MKKILFLFIALFTTTALFSQNELGVTGGVMYYLGDLNPNYFLGKPHLSGGLVYRYKFNSRWALRTNLLYGNISDNDLDHKREDRALNFRSRIFEAATHVEFNFFKFALGSRNYWVTPYMSFGAGVFYFNPQTQYTDPATEKTTWVDLRKYNTEGQGLPDSIGGIGTYSPVQFALPVGLGIKFALGKMVCLSFDWAYRITFTDYLDDVSGVYFDKNILLDEYGRKSEYLSDPTRLKKTGEKRGDKSIRDYYSYAGVTLTFNLNPTKPCHGVKRYD